jgi:UDP-N-acetylmuramate dehydrogenase
MTSLQDIRRFFKGTIKLGEPMANYASLGIGGPADYLFAPSSREDLIGIVKHLRATGIPFVFAGRGSNVLASEQGFHGAVIMLEPGVCGIRLERSPSGEATVHAAAGARLASLVDFCVIHALSGMEPLGGFPGTVGGMVARSSAGPAELIRGVVAGVEIMRLSEFSVVAGAPEKHVGSKTGTERDIVLGATFRLKTGDREQLMRARREALIRRNAELPLNVANAGIMFRDPEGKKAAELVVAAGMKGARRGAAVVSERHANMLLNTGGAAVEDAVNLLRQVQQAVREKTGTELMLAMRLIGFDKEPMREVA